MAYTSIYFYHPHTGAIKTAPVGFSWTTLFFGLLPAVFRGHWSNAAIQLIIGGITFGLSVLVFAFIYNKMYIEHLLGEGFKVRGVSKHNVDYVEEKLGIELPVISNA